MRLTGNRVIGILVCGYWTKCDARVCRPIIMKKRGVKVKRDSDDSYGEEVEL